MNRIEFGRYLLKIRMDLGLNLDEMAKKSGVHYTTLANLERGGIIEPRDSTIEKTAKAYGVPVEKFDSVFHPDETDLSEEHKKADEKLKIIQNDTSFAIAGRNITLTDFDLPLDVKEFIINLYQEAKGKKIPDSE